MAIDLQRVNVKLYLEDGANIAPEEAFRVFNRWISETTDEVLIDVADYTHVPRGPQTLLVGHESDYALDTTDGRLGLRYARKRPVTGDIRTRLRNALGAALSACERLERAAEIDGRVRFRTDEILLTARDRLNVPNTDATFVALREDLETVVAEICGAPPLDLTRTDDERQCFTVHIRTGGDRTVAAMAASLAA